jgi:hypothetical protein
MNAKSTTRQEVQYFQFDVYFTSTEDVSVDIGSSV